MSQIDSILGLPGLAVQRVNRKLGIHVWAKPTTRPPCAHCASDAVRIKATHSLVGPANMPAAVLQGLNKAAVKTVNEPEFKERLIS